MCERTFRQFVAKLEAEVWSRSGEHALNKPPQWHCHNAAQRDDQQVAGSAPCEAINFNRPHCPPPTFLPSTQLPSRLTLTVDCWVIRPTDDSIGWLMSSLVSRAESASTSASHSRAQSPSAINRPTSAKSGQPSTWLPRGSSISNFKSNSRSIAGHRPQIVAACCR